MSTSTDIRQSILDEQIDAANSRLRDGIRLAYFGRSTETGNASVVRYDAHGEVGLEALGSPRECWNFLKGFIVALDIVGR